LESSGEKRLQVRTEIEHCSVYVVHLMYEICDRAYATQSYKLGFKVRGGKLNRLDLVARERVGQAQCVQ